MYSYVFATYHLLTPLGETDLLNFFDCLKAQILEFHSYGKFFICGEFNVRIGSLPEIGDSELLINHREHIDKSVNSHGKAL